MRKPLSKERVMQAALKLVDKHGIDALSMRTLASTLGVEAMSLYKHVANKDEILDGLVDVVFASVAVPEVGGDWREQLAKRSRSMRTALKKHRWAIGLMESRLSPGPATLHHHNSAIGTLLAAGFSMKNTGHAYALLDAFVFGFAVQETSLPFDGADEFAALTPQMLESASAYPHMMAFMVEHAMKPGYDFGNEFEVGLGLVLDAVATLNK